MTMAHAPVRGSQEGFELAKNQSAIDHNLITAQALNR